VWPELTQTTRLDVEENDTDVILRVKVAAKLPAAQLCQLAIFMPRNRAPMPALTSAINTTLANNLTHALARLRLARTLGDHQETDIAERRLNWLIDTHLQRALKGPKS